MARKRGVSGQHNRRNSEPHHADESETGANAATETSSGTPPSHDDIARRAYQLYERRGAEQGHDQEDWLEAERELREPTEDTPG